MSSNANKTTVVVTFVQEGTDGPDVAYRLKRLLKAALRCYGLRCTSARFDGPCPECSRRDALILGMSERLADASEVLGRAAHRLGRQQRAAVIEELKRAKAAVAQMLKRVG